MKVWLIVPAFNEEDNISRVADEIRQAFDGEDYTLLFVNDGSSDNTWREIEKASDDPHVRGIGFSRNRGKECAVDAGLREFDGDCAVLLDCDLQHPPAVAKKMLDLYKTGNFDIISSVKEENGYSHSFVSNAFNFLFKAVSGIDLKYSSDFKLLSKKVADAVNSQPQSDRFFRAIVKDVGFREGFVNFEVRDRAAGKTKWSFKSLTRYALRNLSLYWNVPSGVIFVSGILFLISAIVCAAVSLPLYAIILFGFSTVQIFLSCIGLYVAKLYNEFRQIPKYYISERTNEKE